MNLAEVLRDARDSYAVKLREFILVNTKHPEVLVCFFEGEDAKYYGPRINMLRPDLAWIPLNCGGKAAVLKIHDVLSHNPAYATARAAYFLDRDFDTTQR